MLHGLYHPVTQCKLSAGLDAKGEISGVHMRISGQSILAGMGRTTGKDPAVFQGLNASGPEASIGYTFPHLLVDHAMRNTHVPPGFWRGVNLNQNAIYLECFIDELAHATGQDPLAFRRTLMSQSPKHLAVLNAAAERAGWGQPLPTGRARGVALHESFGSVCAQVAEVALEGGRLRVHRVVVALDCGTVVNPDTVEAQLQSAVVYGLSAALMGEITLKDGRVQQRNFPDYDAIRLADMPRIDTVLLPSTAPPGGVGEPGTPPVAPAVANALFALTGERLRRLPLRPAQQVKIT
jgi:isoquinoline 1-oxidoreductase beta subunit